MNISPLANRVSPEIIVVSGADYSYIEPSAENIEGVPLMSEDVSWGEYTSYRVDPNKDYSIVAIKNNTKYNFDLPVSSISQSETISGNNQVIVNIYNGTSEKTIEDAQFSNTHMPVNDYGILMCAILILVTTCLFFTVFGFLKLNQKPRHKVNFKQFAPDKDLHGYNYNYTGDSFERVRS